MIQTDALVATAFKRYFEAYKSDFQTSKASVHLEIVTAKLHESKVETFVIQVLIVSVG